MPLPYSIQVAADGVISFSTTRNVTYKALFVGIPSAEEPQLEGLVFDFTFERAVAAYPSPAHPGPDARIRPTVERILSRFFEQVPDGIIYFSCDSTDGRHWERQRIFNRWYAAHQQVVTQIPFQIPGGTDATNQPLPDIIGGILFLKSHSLHVLVENFIGSEILVYTSAKLQE